MNATHLTCFKRATVSLSSFSLARTTRTCSVIFSSFSTTSSKELKLANCNSCAVFTCPHTHTHTHTHSDLSIYARHAQVWLCEHTHTCTRTRTSCTNARKQLHASRNCALWYLHMHTYKQRLKCAAFTLNFGHVSLQIGVILCRAMAKANETAVSGQTVGCRHCNKVDSIEKETCKLRVRTFVLCLSCCAIRSISSSLA